jgi:hypothetical protein
MKKIPLLAIAISIFIATNISAQVNLTPAEKMEFKQVSSYNEMVDFIKQLDDSSDLMSVEQFGRSAKGRDLFALKFSKSGFGTDKSKIRVLIHAQQHGNEQSGKEGALILARELIKPENASLFDHIDLMLVPQMNPDGSELNRRRNGNEMDLNRNHLIMTEPEVIALHKLFDQYLFEVTMDVHEYSPYSEDWMNLGYRRNSDLLIGFNTNPQIPSSIRENQLNFFGPFYSEFLLSRGVSNGMYSPGGPPELDYIRYSTFDINDGRQSFGIQNTLSFIEEGMNGKDNYVENLSHRAYSQSVGMRALLEYAFNHYKEIKTIVERERENLITGNDNVDVPLQMEHVTNGSKLNLNVLSLKTNNDSVIIVNDFRPVVKPTLTIKKPYGYLIPKSQQELIEWINRQGFKTIPLKNTEKYIFEQITISQIDSLDFERDMIALPKVESKEIEFQKNKGISLDEYVFIPTAQLKGNMLIIGLEPQSELGLATYSQFAFLMKEHSLYPVIRVRNSNLK